MSGNEMREMFSVLFNNITSNQAPGLNDHEISLCLTKGQDEVLKGYFNPKGNKYGEGFDDNQKRQIDFSAITCVAEKESFSEPIYDGRFNSKSVDLPTDVWMIVNERVEVRRPETATTTTNLIVMPISFGEYDKNMSKPFKRPLHYQAWRLINNAVSNKSDLIVGPTDVISKYVLRYVRRPKPIIIGDLDDLTINGFKYGGDTTPTEPAENEVYGDKACELDPILHEEIVQRAVEIAKISWTATGQDNAQMVIQAGQRSE